MNNDQFNQPGDKSYKPYDPTTSDPQNRTAGGSSQIRELKADIHDLQNKILETKVNALKFSSYGDSTAAEVNRLEIAKQNAQQRLAAACDQENRKVGWNKEQP